VKTICVRHWLE